MSLLMQALKKAEQSKQKQNALAAEAAFSSPDSIQSTLASALPIQPPAMEMLEEAPSQDVGGGIQAPFDMQSQGLSLSPQLVEKTPEPSIDAAAPNEAPNGHQELSPETASQIDESVAIDAAIPTLDPLERPPTPAENSAPLQAPLAPTGDNAVLPNFAAQTLVDPEPKGPLAAPHDFDEKSVARPRVDPRQAELAGQKEAEQAVEREKAKSVFSSKSPQGGARKRLLAIAGVPLLVVFGGTAYIYLQGNTIVPPVPMRVQNETPSDVLAVPENNAEPAVVDSAASVATPDLAKPKNTATTKEQATTEVASGLTPKLAGVKEVAPETTLKATPKVTPKVASDPPINTQTERQPSAKLALSTEKIRYAPATSVEGSGAIQIRKTNSGNQINPDLALAYQSLIAGDANAAESQYQAVLRQEPNNRDALLGLAAIALNQRQAERSGAFYGKLLELDPNDPEAIAGLTSLQQGDPAQSESRLKKALNQSPHAGAILFALGNLYAQQSRWSEAQQSYFRAYDTAPSNADYAFNLAVSLDRLNQGKLAKDYYQRALNLGQSGPGNFSRVGVQKRIKELETPSGE